MTDFPLRFDKSDDGRSWAIFSRFGSHRFALGRDWSGMFDPEPRTLLSCGLNPSDAGVEDDTTIRKDVGFASRLGCTRLLKINLFSFIETKSEEVKPSNGLLVLPQTDEVIRAEVAKLDPLRTLVLAAWGSHPMATAQRIDEVLALLPRPVFCLGTTADGQPRHTSRLAYATPVSIWKA